MKTNYCKHLLLLFLSFIAIHAFSADRTKLDSLFQQISVEQEDTLRLRLFMEIGYQYRRINSDSSVYYYNSVIKTIDSQEDRTETHTFLKAKTMSYLGYVYYANNDVDKAIEAFEEAISLALPLGRDKFTGTCYNTLTRLYTYQGNWTKSEAFNKKAIGLFLKIDYKYGLASCYINNGIIYNEQCKYNEAIQYYMKALEIAHEIDHPYTIAAAANSNIANIFYYQEDYKKAIDYHKKALKIYSKINDHKGLSATYNNLSSCYLNLKKSEEALSYIDSSLLVSVKNNDLRSQGYSYFNKGELYYKLEDYDKALHSYLKSYEIRDNLKDKYGLINSRNVIASCYIKLGKFTKAYLYLKPNVEITDQDYIIGQKKDQCKYLKEIYKQQSDYKNAYKYLELERNLGDSIFSEEKYKSIAELETKYQTELKEQQIALLEKDNELKNESLKTQRRFSVLLVVLFILVVVLVFVYILFSKNKQKNIKNKLIIKTLQSERKVLRSQMNPHFIYNSLNSIQAFISSENTYEAEKYLSRFARLMRGILENSRHEFVTLDKEIEVLTLYMELEQLRFEKRFDFKIDIDKEMETDFISIPPMILQPFLENAILHGFRDVKKGMLILAISEHGDRLKCVIDDNGIGRKNAAKKPLNTKKKSLAIQITKERLDALSDQTGKLANFEIIDKTNEAGEATGTQVIIEIPLVDID